MVVPNTFANNLVALRKQHGYSQKEFAARMSITTETLKAYENFWRVPKYPTLKKIADLFGVTVDDILFEDLRGGQKPPPRKETLRDVVLKEFYLQNAEITFADEKLVIKIPLQNIRIVEN